jgi:hypothetical protein
MQCPTCDYQLSPFDKECPRCKHFERKEQQPAAFPKHQEEAVQPPSLETPPAPEQTAQKIPAKKRKLSAFDKFARGFAAFMILIVVSIVVAAFYFSYTKTNITGRWVDKSGWNTYQFNSDGTAIWDFNPPGMSAIYDITYTTKGGTLTETFNHMNGQPIPPGDKYFGHSLTRWYTIENDELVMTNPDNGLQWTFSRDN